MRWGTSRNYIAVKVILLCAAFLILVAVPIAAQEDDHSPPRFAVAGMLGSHGLAVGGEWRVWKYVILAGRTSILGNDHMRGIGFRLDPFPAEPARPYAIALLGQLRCQGIFDTAECGGAPNEWQTAGSTIIGIEFFLSNARTWSIAAEAGYWSVWSNGRRAETLSTFVGSAAVRIYLL